MAVAPQYQRYRLKCKNPRCPRNGAPFGSWNKSQETCSRSCGAQMRRKATGPNSPRESGMRGGYAAAKARDKARWDAIQQKWPTMPDGAKRAIRVFLNLRYLAGRKSGERGGYALGFSRGIGEQIAGQHGTPRLRQPIV